MLGSQKPARRLFHAAVEETANARGLLSPSRSVGREVTRRQPIEAVSVPSIELTGVKYSAIYYGEAEPCRHRNQCSLARVFRWSRDFAEGTPG